MEYALWKGEKISAGKVADRGNYELEREVRLASRNRQLYCVDKNCPQPIVKYCHGEKKGAYFSHICDSGCDYAAFDKRYEEFKEVRSKLCEHLLSSGFEADVEQKLLEHRYSQLSYVGTDGRLRAVEFGNNRTGADRIFKTEEEYGEKDIGLQWIVIGKITEKRFEHEFFFLKRFLLNEAIVHGFVMISPEENYRVAQFREDNEEYVGNVILPEYGKLYFETAEFRELTIYDNKIAIRGFEERYGIWLNNKRLKIKELEEKSRKEKATKKFNQLPVRAPESYKAVEMSKIIKCYTKEDIYKNIGQQDKQVRDKNGKRWLQCEICNKIDAEDAFFSYGGKNHLNLGICNDCKNKNK